MKLRGMLKCSVIVGIVFLATGTVFADIYYEEISKMEMEQSDEMKKMVRDAQVRAGVGHMANMQEMKMPDYIAKIWLTKDKKKSEEDMSKEGQKEMMGNVTENMPNMMDNLMKNPMFANLPPDQLEKMKAQMGGENMKKEMKKETDKIDTRKTKQKYFLLDREAFIETDPNKNTYKEMSFKEIIEKDKQDKEQEAAMKKFVGDIMDKMDLGENMNKKKEDQPDWSVLQDEPGEEKTVAGYPCKLYTLEARMKVKPTKDMPPAIAKKMAGKTITPMKLEVWMAPELAAQGKEFYEFENKLLKKLGKIHDGKSQLDFLYKSPEGWAKEMVRKMQALKGFPVQRTFVVEPMNTADMEDMTGDVMEGAMEDPQMKAQIDSMKPKIMADREAMIKDPSKKKEFEERGVESYKRDLGMDEPTARKEVKNDIENFIKDPKYYDSFMKKMMGHAQKNVGKQAGKMKMKMSFIQTLAKVKTSQIQSSEFEVPKDYRRE